MRIDDDYGFESRFGRTTTGSFLTHQGMVNCTANPQYPNGVGVGAAAAASAVAPTTSHRTLPSMIPFGRSNSLGRSLPPIPSNHGAPPVTAPHTKNLTATNGPTLIRRRTFEDDTDQRMDWI